MEMRTLTITVQPDWKTALRAAGKAAQAKTYQGETLNAGARRSWTGRTRGQRWFADIHVDMHLRRRAG